MTPFKGKNDGILFYLKPRDHVLVKASKRSLLVKYFLEGLVWLFSVSKQLTFRVLLMERSLWKFSENAAVKEIFSSN